MHSWMGLGSSRFPKGRMMLYYSTQMLDPRPGGPSCWALFAVCPRRSGGAGTLAPACPRLIRSGTPIPRVPPTLPSWGLSASGLESLPPPCSTPPRPPRLPGSRGSASLAPRPHPPNTRAHLPRPHPSPRTAGVPVLLHTLGKVPRSRGCVWGACDAQA